MYTWLRDTLPNGMRVVTVEVPHLHAAMASLYVRAGSRHDPPEQSGISHFLEHIFFRGCKAYPSSMSLCSALERAGGNLNGVTTRDYGYYYTLIHPEAMSTAFSVLKEMISAPLMKDVEMEREVILEEILDEVDESGRLIDVDTLSKRMAFPGHPLSLPIAGNRQTVCAIRTEDLCRHHTSCYGASNLVLSVAGPVKHDELLEEAVKTFGSLPQGRRSKTEPPAPLPSGPRLEYVSHRESQTAVRCTFPALTENHPDYPALMLLTRLLDDGLASRLQQEVVERRGLAYAVSAGIDVMGDSALLEIDACTAHAKTPELLAAVRATLSGLIETPPSQEELGRAIARHRCDIDFMRDSVADLAGWFGVGELHDTSCTLEKHILDAAAVGSDDISRVASMLLARERMLVVVVGLADENATRKVIEG